MEHSGSEARATVLPFGGSPVAILANLSLRVVVVVPKRRVDAARAPR